MASLRLVGGAFGLVLFVGCPAPTPPAAPVTAPPPPAASVEPPPAAPVVPARTDYAVGESPMALALAPGYLVWTDGTGAIWSMKRSGGEPAQLSDQHGAGFMFRPIAAGDQILVAGKRDFARVTPATGEVKKLALRLPEDPVDVVANDQAVFATLFKRDEIMAIPVAGGVPTTLFSQKRGVLAVYESTLYSISYATGVLVAVETKGGKPRTVAKGFSRPTALAVDATHAFIYTERDKTLRSVELASGKASTLATELENADDLIADGAWVYTFSWPNKVLRIAKDGSGQDVLADDLKSPHDIAVDADAIYVVSRDQNKIVRLPKR